MNTKYVTVKTDSGQFTHIPGWVGDYETLCGLACDDESLDMKVIQTPKGYRVDCLQCVLIWEMAQKYKSKDFA